MQNEAGVGGEDDAVRVVFLGEFSVFRRERLAGLATPPIWAARSWCCSRSWPR
jgi:hypothetical protein